MFHTVQYNNSHNGKSPQNIRHIDPGTPWQFHFHSYYFPLFSSHNRHENNINFLKRNKTAKIVSKLFRTKTRKFSLYLPY